MNLTERVRSAIKHRNNFSLSYESVITADFGDFVPIVCKEMVPTDSFQVQSQAFFRLAPLATPTFGKIHAFINNFFVPIRILMPDNEFEDSMTGGIEGDYPETFPFITYGSLLAIYNYLDYFGSPNSAKRFAKLCSYLGLGNIIYELNYIRENYKSEEDISGFTKWFDTALSQSISLLPFLALFRIFYDYYAPMNIEEDAGLREMYTHKYKGIISYEYDISALMSGSPIMPNDTDIRRLALAFDNLVTCYNKDYFTMAMTRPQRGAASSVPVELGTEFNDGLKNSTSTDQAIKVEHNNTDKVFTGTQAQLANSVIGQYKVQVGRLAEKIQSFLERNNIAGGRYFEQVAARYGVKLSSSKLQRSEYLGGNDFWVQVSDVTSTSDTEGASLGEQAGKGIALGKRSSSYTSDEYGFFIGLLHFVPETNGLVDGLDRMWTRESKFDYWQPELEDTGMQPVYNKELNRHLAFYPRLDEGNNPNGVFGYNPRYAEYKVSNPILGGDFALNNQGYSPAILNSMNLFRRVGVNDDVFDDSETPILSRDFVSILGLDAGQNNFNRIFQNTNSDFDHFFINCQISIGANRPMIGYAEAGLEFSHEDGGNKLVTLAYGGMRK